jgi:hypothetical protein
MDILRAEAEELLDAVELSETQYETIQITTANTFERRTLNHRDVQAFIDLPSNTSTKIVRMQYHSEIGIKSLPQLFGHIWRSFELDPYMIHMFHRNVPGFFQLADKLNFYVNCQAYWLFWCYNASNSSTNAIILSRLSRGGRAAYPRLCARLERYRSLAIHPLFFALVAAQDRIAYMDGFLKEQHQHVGRTEEYTGFSHFHMNKRRVDPETELDQLSNRSRLASSVLVGLADMMQHFEISSAIVDALCNGINTNTFGADVMQKEAEIKSIATMLRPQLKQRRGYLSYIKERAQNQVTVVCLSCKISLIM